MTKGSTLVRDSQSSADVQVDRVEVEQSVIILENSLSSRQVKDMRCVVFCGPKDCRATGRTHLGRLRIGICNQSLKLIEYKNAKLRPAWCENGLMLYVVRRIQPSKARKAEDVDKEVHVRAATLNGSQGRR